MLDAIFIMADVVARKLSKNHFAHTSVGHTYQV